MIITFMRRFKNNIILVNCSLLFLWLAACAKLEPTPFIPSTGHISQTAQQTSKGGDIPEFVEPLKNLPPPATDTLEQEKYTVVVNEVPIKELLFALARDAKINIDIDPQISGVVTINAVEQSLPDILDRITYQAPVRYEFKNSSLYIQTDTPFLQTYTIDYLNLSRDLSSNSSVSTQIASASGGDSGSAGSGGGNNSTTDVTTASTHYFWSRLVSNISAILGEPIGGSSGAEVVETSSVIPNPESGILTVKATLQQHKKIESLIEQVLASAKRQVLIQVTIVEVSLNKDYQAGIDWAFLDAEGRSGLNFVSSTLSGTSISNSVSSSFEITANGNRGFLSNLNNIPGREGNLVATVRLLDEFGDTKILSSPQIMVLNNQTALLKVVENIVYFEVDSETTAGQLGSPPIIATDTTAKTVPVGIVMSVTPQINADGTIILNVRPTISRLSNFVNDPNPELASQNIENPVPRIKVREMESVLRLVDGQIGVLGGLMSDESSDLDAGLPGVKDISLFGNLFKSKSAQYSKTELVIFLRPVLINTPGISGRLSNYKKYLDVYSESLVEPVDPGADYEER